MKSFLKKCIAQLDSLMQSIHLLISPVPESKNLRVEYSEGKLGDCGIASADMLIKYLGGELNSDWDKFKTHDNYMVNVGWKHHGLKSIIENYTNSKLKVFRNKSSLYVIKKLSEGYPVIASVRVPAPNDLDQTELYKSLSNTKSLENHIVLVSGYGNSNIIIQDPRNIGVYSKNLVVSKRRFSKIFNGNGVAAA
jgi:uncharacterized protein YvpB